MARTLKSDNLGRCVDCEPGSKRPAPWPGPRCATHHREKKQAVKEASHASHVLRTYGITKELYDELYRLQGGKCYVCQISTGKARRLAVDHDHRCCPGPKSCGKCVRGLACGHCNHDILPWVGDHASDWDRVANVLQEPIGAMLLNGSLLQFDVDIRFGRLSGAVLDKSEQSGTLKT
jgi:hypothetical protein